MSPFLLERLYNTPVALAPFKNEVLCEFARNRVIGEKPEKIDATVLDMPKPVALSDEASFLSAGGTRKSFRSDGPIACIDIRGTLVQKGGWLDADSGLVGYDFLLKQYRAAEKDPDIKGKFTRIDSGGGEVPGMFAAVEEIASMAAAEGGKPHYVYLDENACSAAYAFACTADRVFGRRECQGGSIAALINFTDKSKMYEKLGLQAVVVRPSWGDRKARGIAGEPVDDELLERLLTMVEDCSNQFVEFVAAMRGIDEKAIRDLRGDVFNGPDLLKFGLIDEIASERQAWDALIAAIEAA